MTGGKVIVLGPTGRNFAAGMSGGIAYVLDPDGTFPARCNTELVELEQCDDEDFERVRALIEEHLERTGSAVAQRTLDSWDELRGAWVKVMPMDYKRALREAAERESVAAGEPPEVAERGDGSGAGVVESGQASAYAASDGDQNTAETGEAGQYEDASVAADRAGDATREAGGDPAKQAAAEEQATEEVLPGHG
jgi:hypothetical protein